LTEGPLQAQPKQYHCYTEEEKIYPGYISGDRKFNEKYEVTQKDKYGK
jgi:hypothetical protein